MPATTDPFSLPDPDLAGTIVAAADEGAGPGRIAP